MPATTSSGHLFRRGLAVIRGEVSMHPRSFALAVTGAVVYALMTVASTWVLGRVTDDVIAPRFEDGEVGGAAVAVAAVAIVGVGLVKAGGIVLRRIAASITQADVSRSLSTAVVQHYQRLPFAYHRSQPAGELLAHASADVEAASDVLAPLPFATGVLTMVVVAFSWLVVTDPWLALVGLLVFPALAVLNVAYQRRVEGPAELAQEQIGRVSAVAHESFDGALVVKALGGEEHEAARFDAEAERLRDAKIHVATLRATFEALLDALPAIGTLLLLVVGSWRIDQGRITVGTLVSFVALFSLMTWPLRLIGYVLSELPRSVVGWDRVQQVLATPVEAHRRARTGSSLPAKVGAEPVPALPLEVVGVRLAYEPASPVLDGVTFTVEAGATVALVGPTGAGKSTLLHVIGGLLRPEAGTVRLGDHDLLDGEGTASRLVSLAFQEPFLFSDTIVENVLLGSDLGADALVDAARLAEAHEFLTRLPHGYETVVGERGATLSGGQRQRVALARALARRPRLLLLDDATSSVDPSTEARILAGLRAHLTATTTLVVASRPSTIALADRVVYLEGGRVAGSGTHADLLERLPAYDRLVRAYEHDRVSR